MRADKMLEQGDLGGLAVWKRILASVDELQSKERPKGATVASMSGRLNFSVLQPWRSNTSSEP